MDATDFDHRMANYQHHYYDYAAYCWDRHAGAFIPAYAAKSHVPYDDVEWHRDLEKRLPAIRIAARKRCR